MRDTICLLLATVFFGAATLSARSHKARVVPSGEASAEQTARLKQKLLEVPTGTMIEVRLLNKLKIRGRLGQVDDQGFSLTTAQNGKIVTQRLVFNEMNSLKKVEGGKGGHIALWMLAGVGALVLICAIVAATQL